LGTGSAIFVEVVSVAEFTKHEPGTFSWTELSTSDFDAGIALYADLFGWEVNKEDIPGGVYATFRVNGKDVAGGSPQREEEKQAGIPPHWNVYVTVDNAEQTAKQAEAAGGSIVAPAFDVMEFGRMAIIADPTGATFCVWEPKTNIGAQLLGETGALSWSEVMTTDPDEAGTFYSEVFGYTMEPFGPEEQGYKVFMKGDAQIAGMMRNPTEGAPSYWGIYFTAEDVDKVAEKIKAAGGQVFMGPQDMPEVGRVSVLADPQGAMFGVIEAPKT
jgi:predicted enzyme related to lactoylglutathione lyase